MKTTLAIIELHYHVEVLQIVLDVLDETQFKIHLYSTQPIVDQLDIKHSVEVHIVEGRLSQYHQNILACDVILINTIEDRFSEYRKIVLNKPTIVRMHNVNTWFGPQKMAKPNSAYERMKFTSYYLRKELFSHLSKKRRQFIPLVNQFIFPADFMIESAISQSPQLGTAYYAKEIPLQFNVNKPLHVAQFNKIGIPGRIDSRKKDYVQALEVFSQLPEGKEIYLLGKPEGRYGKQIIADFHNQLEPKLKVITSNEYVSPQKFAQQISNCDVLFLPIIEETSYTMYREYYGRTKLSGAVNDALRWGKPFLIPSSYPIENNMKPLAIPYVDSNDAVELLRKGNFIPKQTDFLSAQDLSNLYSELLMQVYRTYS